MTLRAASISHKVISLAAVIAAAANVVGFVLLHRSAVRLNDRISLLEAKTSATSSQGGRDDSLVPQVRSDPSLTIDDTPSLGSADAEVVLIEFADFVCPYCREYANQTFSKVRHGLIDTGEVQYVFKQLPLDRLHPRSSRLSMAAECAFEQGKFWQLHDELFRTGPSTMRGAIKLDHVGVSWSRFEACSDGELVKKRLGRDAADAARLGVHSTPTFLFARRAGSNRVTVIRRVTGAQPYEAFVAALASVRARK